MNISFPVHERLVPFNSTTYACYTT